MSRLLVTAYGALVSGATLWAVVGSAAAMLSSRLPGGTREGANAMGGFFFIGGACGVLGLLLGGWLTWRMLANPERAGTVALAFTGVLAVLGIGIFIASQPTLRTADDYPGEQASFEVEVSMPSAIVSSLSKSDRLEFQLRAGDGTDSAIAMRDRIRQEGDRAVVPGAFPVRVYPRTKIFAVMKNDSQIMSATLTVEVDLESSTDWSEWQTMEEGLLARWRLVVTPER